MSIVIMVDNNAGESWAQALRKELPDTTVEIYPNVEDSQEVTFVACWKPEINISDEFPNVMVIQSLGAGVRHITNTQTIPENCQITRVVDEQLSEDMWEYVLTQVLSEMKNINLYYKQQQDKYWKQHRYRRIQNVNISILGLGKIGGYVAEHFASLGFNVKGWSKSEKNLDNVESYYGEDTLKAVLLDADFLINILPLTEDTSGILTTEIFQELPKDSVLINVGRGGHVVEEDLLKALDNNQIAGAVLDVFSTEPLPETHTFWTHPKIRLTPHVASMTNIQTAVEQIVDNYHRMKEGKDLLHVVSLDRGY